MLGLRGFLPAGSTAPTPAPSERRLHCSEVWGGIRDANLDLHAAGLSISLWSAAADGDRGGDVAYVSVCHLDTVSRIVVADVAGHGIAIGPLSEWLYDAVARRVDSFDDVGILEELNRLACARRPLFLATAAILTYDRETGILHRAYAGHPPALLYRRTADRWELLPGAPTGELVGLPLGVDVAARYDRATGSIQAGDRLLLFTDGISDARDAAGRRFERDIAAVAHPWRDAPVAQMKAGIRRAVLEHVAGAAERDDATLLAIAVT